MVKELLEQYQSNKFHIEKRKQLRIKKLNITEDDIPSCTPTYSDMPKGTGTSDSTYATVAKKESDIEKLDMMIADLEQDVKVVDSLIATLKHKDQQIVNMRIKDRMSFEEIARRLYYADYKSVQRRYSELEEEMEKIYNDDKLTTN